MKEVFKKLPFISALRGYAILLVIILHTSQYGTKLTSIFWDRLVNKGHFGVQLFFLASAFTLFLSLSHREESESNPTRNFYIRRFFRIAPLYYLGIIYYLFQNQLSGRAAIVPGLDHPIDLILNISFLNGFNPNTVRTIVPGGWSISAEVIFYLMLPFLFKVIKNEKHALNFLLFTLIFRGAIIEFFKRHILITDVDTWKNFTYFNFLNHLPVFAMGIFMFFITTKKDNFKFNPNAIFLFVLLAFMQLSISLPFMLPAHILYSFLFLLFALALHSKMPKVLVNKFINYIGEISFSMYLSHFAVIYWLTHFKLINFFNNQLVNFGFKYTCIVLITILISSFLYFLIEKPFQQIGKNLILKLELRNIKYQLI